MVCTLRERTVTLFSAKNPPYATGQDKQQRKENTTDHPQDTWLIQHSRTDRVGANLPVPLFDVFSSAPPALPNIHFTHILFACRASLIHLFRFSFLYWHIITSSSISRVFSSTNLRLFIVPRLLLTPFTIDRAGTLASITLLCRLRPVSRVNLSIERVVTSYNAWCLCKLTFSATGSRYCYQDTAVCRSSRPAPVPAF